MPKGIRGRYSITKNTAGWWVLRDREDGEVLGLYITLAEARRRKRIFERSDRRNYRTEKGEDNAQT